ncbi:hypothetical protein A8B84_11820 [Marinobacter sp. EhC06]|jgi:hypothetical protein|nr:hypothetical protein A8B84_11820 [Marinobacter sp. EhC06]OAN93931.1 hypothetical protein A8B80_15830 [Marinobacter sp. EhN04]
MLGSNLQPFTNQRDVADRKDEDLTQEPEMINRFFAKPIQATLIPPVSQSNFYNPSSTPTRLSKTGLDVFDLDGGMRASR